MSFLDRLDAILTLRSHSSSGGHMEAFKFLVKRGSKSCNTLDGATLLMEAVEKNQPDFVWHLIQAAPSLGVDIHQKDKQGNNVLFYAVAGGKLEIFRTLVNAGVKVEDDNNKRTLLMQGALHGHLDTVRYLLNNAPALGLDLHQKDNDGRNVLFYGVEGGNVDLLDTLIQHGIEPSQDKDSRTLIMLAARTGNAKILDYLLQRTITLQMDLNGRDKNGENALFYGARSQSSCIVGKLLECGIEVCNNIYGINVLSQSLMDKRDSVVEAILNSSANLQDAVNGKDACGRSVLCHYVDKGELGPLERLSKYYRPDADYDAEGASILMRACLIREPQYFKILTYLVEHIKVNMRRIDKRGRDALFYAVQNANLEAVTYLLERVSEPQSDQNGCNILMMAAAHGNDYITELLLESKHCKTLLNQTDLNGRSCVHYWAMHGRPSVLQRILKFSCDINSRDIDGLTPLMYACAGGHHIAVVTLLKRNANLETVDNQGRNAVHYCFRKSVPSFKCLKFLTQFGIDLNKKTERGVTPLMVACKMCAKSDISLIKYMLEHGSDPVLQDVDGKDSYDYCPFDCEYVKAMMRNESEISQEEQDALNQQLPALCESIEINSVIRGLIKAEVLTRTLQFEVMKLPASDRVPKLVSVISQRGQNAFRKFCLVLKDTGLLEVSYTLLKSSYRKSSEIFW